jgi:ELWxxDGT repeat protein
LAGTINLTGGPKFITSQTALNQALFFVLSSQTEDSELWKCDQKGITLVKKFKPSNDSVPSFLTALGNAIYFQASDPTRGAELWRSDGTEKGTVLLKDINSKGNGSPTLLEVIGDHIYFTADDGIHGFEVWKTDGTQAGATLVKDINPGINHHFLINLLRSIIALYLQLSRIRMAFNFGRVMA